MSSTKAFWDGFIFLIVGVLTSIVLVFMCGVYIDGIIAQLESIDILNVPGVWGSAASTDIYFWQRFAYIIAISPAILGVIAQILAAVMRERVEEIDVGTSQFSEEIDI